MATIDLGKIKLVWRGTYAGGTAYTVDDVVQHTDTITSSFICTTASTGNAPSTGGSVHSSWAYLAKGGVAGTDGTDLTSTLTTQGDVVYRDGSGLARLGFGTSGHVLTTKGTGANPVWEAASGGKVLQWTTNYITARYSNSSTSFADFSGLQVFSITPSATSSKIVLMSDLVGHCANWNVMKYLRKIGSGSYADFGLPTAATGSQSNAHFSGFYDSDTAVANTVNWSYLDSPNTTDQVSYKLQALSYNPTTVYINRTTNDGNYTAVGSLTSSVMLLEIGA